MVKDELVAERLPITALADICRQWQVDRLWAFGSVLGDFRPESDVDLLVEFLPEAQVGLLDLADMQDELAELLGRSVDLMPLGALQNPYIRRSILASRVQVYAA